MAVIYHLAVPDLEQIMIRSHWRSQACSKRLVHQDWSFPSQYGRIASHASPKENVRFYNGMLLCSRESGPLSRAASGV